MMRLVWGVFLLVGGLLLATPGGAQELVEEDEAIVDFDSAFCLKSRGDIAREDYKEVVRSGCIPEIDGYDFVGHRLHDAVPRDDFRCTFGVEAISTGADAAFRYEGMHWDCGHPLGYDSSELDHQFSVQGEAIRPMAIGLVYELESLDCGDTEVPSSIDSDRVLVVDVVVKETGEVLGDYRSEVFAVVADADCEPKLVRFRPSIYNSCQYAIPIDGVSTSGTKLRFDLYWVACAQIVFGTYEPGYAQTSLDLPRGTLDDRWSVLRSDHSRHARIELELGQECEGPLMRIADFDNNFLFEGDWAQFFAVPAAGGCDFWRIEQMKTEWVLDFAPTEIPETFEELVAMDRLHAAHADILRLYWASFDRQPDVGGALWWVEAYDSGSWPTLVRIAEHFVVSEEFIKTYGDTTNPEFVDLLYLNVLDRPGESRGRAFWISELDNGRRSRGEALADFSYSQEFRDKHPLPPDGRPAS